MNITRFRKFNTRDVYPGGHMDNDMCMAVRAGNRIFLRGQTGLDLNQNMIDPNDAGAQALECSMRFMGQVLKQMRVLRL